MAEAFFGWTSAGWAAASAGTNPDDEIHPLTVEVMKEMGIDVSKRRPRLLTDEMLKRATKVIVMDSAVMRHVPRRYLSKTENWRIKPLLGKDRTQVVRIRDEIKKRVEQLAAEIEAQPRN